MSSEAETSQLKSHAEKLRTRFDELKDEAEELTEAAKADVNPRLERLEIMLHAFERDAEEVLQGKGASPEKTIELEETIGSEFRDLQHELDALVQGNPTTVSAALDATIHAVERAGNALSKYVKGGGKSSS